MADIYSERNYPPSTCRECGRKTYDVPGRKGLCIDCYCHKEAVKLQKSIDRLTSKEYREKVRKW